MNMTITPKEINDFWYSERIKNHWFSSTPELDNEILEKYGAIWEQAALGQLDNWCHTPEGCLALVILLDQFPLNMFRGQARSFKTESKAREIALQAINKNFHNRLTKDKLVFLFMPFMHSENLQDQDFSLKLYSEHHMDTNRKFAEHHRDIVRRFGRFPHRNQILDRQSSEEELAYLASENAFKG